MNIFWLDKDPKLSAEYACDKHVVKMITEYSQLLHSALYSLGFDGFQMKRISNMNHPCAVWVRADFANFVYLCRLTEEYYHQYRIRYGNRQHLSFLKMQDTLQSLSIRAIRQAYRTPGRDFYYSVPVRELKVEPWLFITVPPLCIKPEFIKRPTGHVQARLQAVVRCYKASYRGDKVRFARWSHTLAPKFMRFALLRKNNTHVK